MSTFEHGVLEPQASIDARSAGACVLNKQSFKKGVSCPKCRTYLFVPPEAGGACFYCGHVFTDRRTPDMRKPFRIRDTRPGGKTFAVDPVMGRINRASRRVKAWCHATKDIGRDELKMLTLTYRPGRHWHKEHLRQFTLTLRKHLGKRLVAYAWCAELQERGEVHYHIIVRVKHGTGIPYPDKAGWWKHGSSNIRKAESILYITKYATKEAQKGMDADLQFPKGLRMFAVWIADVIDALTRYQFRMSTLPRWLSEIITPLEDVFPKRAEGGGWLIGKYWVASPYEIVGGNVRSVGRRSDTGNKMPIEEVYSRLDAIYARG